MSNEVCRLQYLARDAREAGRHLKAMIGMMGFDEEQLEQIAYAVENKKSQSSWEYDERNTIHQFVWTRFTSNHCVSSGRKWVDRFENAYGYRMYRKNGIHCRRDATFNAEVFECFLRWWRFSLRLLLFTIVDNPMQSQFSFYFTNARVWYRPYMSDCIAT